ncbi:non-ribosomal peptide synthetase, partial [Bacillus spizizenii]|nr:non-ribosomal peptide synthetase [Bacillus spizizenii]
MSKSLKGDTNSNTSSLKKSIVNKKNSFSSDFLSSEKTELSKNIFVFELSKQLSDKLNDFSAKSQETLHSVLSTAMLLLLHNHTKKHDVRIGVFGLVSKHVHQPLVLRQFIKDHDSIKHLLHNVKNNIEQMIENPEFYSLSKVEHTIADFPFDVMIILDHPEEKISVECYTAVNTVFTFAENAGYIKGSIHYNGCLYDEYTMNKLSKQFLIILEALLNDPNNSVKELIQFSINEARCIGFSIESKYPKNMLIHELFEEQAKKHPHKTALILGDSTLCYQDLNCRANQLARYLQNCGVKKGDLVGVSMDRSMDLYISILAILKSGGAYVPVDPYYPKQRLAFLFKDSQIDLLLTHKKHISNLPNHKAEVICVDHINNQIDVMETSNICLPGSGDDLAYVMYTSGSTGVPKGVSIMHRGVVRLVKGNHFAEMDENKTFLQLAPVAFDASTFEIWGSLLNGGCLAIMPSGIPTPDEIAEAIKKYNVTTLWLTAGLFSVVVDQQLEALAGLHQLLVGGDVVSVPHVRKVLALGKVQLINGYGPTEGTTFTCCYPVPSDWSGDSLPIGKPISNTEVYILDAQLKPVPPGISGELYIGGDGLAKEYWHRPKLTTERFISHPFSDDPAARLYKTGDIVRSLHDGNIEFIGRIDQQVKIRGYRIELGEIEAQLLKHKDVKEVVVTVGSSGMQDLYTCAYFTSEYELGRKELQDFLREFLPEYMIPSYVQRLDKMPLTVNGKIDRNALPKPDLNQGNEYQYEAPGNEFEEKLSVIWGRVLGREQPGINENFFDTGGHSLRATMLVSRIRKE